VQQVFFKGIIGGIAIIIIVYYFLSLLSGLFSDLLYNQLMIIEI